MNVTCPNCQNRYVLPESLMGRAGARVHCPDCGKAFDVDAGGEVRAVADPFPEVTLPPTPAPPAPAAAPAPPVTVAAAEAPARSWHGLEAWFPSRAAAPPAAAPAAEAPLDVARRLLEALDAAEGAEITAAAHRGTLFSSFGPKLLAAFEEYRRVVGRGTSVAPFREAVLERWGVDLSPTDEGPER